MRWAPPSRQARHYLVATAAGWLLWIVAVLVSEAVLWPATPVFLYAMVLGFQIEAGVSEPSGWADYVLPGRGRGIGERLLAPLQQLRVAFVHDIAVASEWNVSFVLGALTILTVVGLAVPLV